MFPQSNILYVKCDSCVKLFTHVGNVRRHIKTVHEGHKDFKYKSCEKLFT